MDSRVETNKASWVKNSRQKTNNVRHTADILNIFMQQEVVGNTEG